MRCHVSIVIGECEAAVTASVGFGFDVLLHGGGQAGDPAILHPESALSVATIQRRESWCLSSAVTGLPPARGIKPGAQTRKARRGRGRQKRTWPSRVPLRINCSAMATVHGGDAAGGRTVRCGKEEKENREKASAGSSAKPLGGAAHTMGLATVVLSAGWLGRNWDNFCVGGKLGPPHVGLARATPPASR